MISAWTKHLKNEEEKTRFKNSVQGSKEVLDRLNSLIGELRTEADNLELNPKMYELPNWDYRQADLNGYKRALKQINRIITLDQQDNG